MGKQKVVIGISMKDQKARSKAFKIAVSLSGVDSTSIQAEKGQLEVVGDVDVVALVSQLRKSLGQAEKKEETPKPQTMTITFFLYIFFFFFLLFIFLKHSGPVLLVYRLWPTSSGRASLE
ncbi:heavy metal-associated isoprenylated plant protein 39-like [Ipomoea triloba]|uniref:heavy metal-associated isoprenylated plant protein 39-like n=1 Tax=Ipomoea triloba TaxID=35885 RepID=UPI00125E1567|nr:heavy metal-associated isoprenylated plant protein 39-like [Ipomoea triloba]